MKFKINKQESIFNIKDFEALRNFTNAVLFDVSKTFRDEFEIHVKVERQVQTGVLLSFIKGTDLEEHTVWINKGDIEFADDSTMELLPILHNTKVKELLTLFSSHICGIHLSTPISEDVAIGLSSIGLSRLIKAKG